MSYAESKQQREEIILTNMCLVFSYLKKTRQQAILKYIVICFLMLCK